MAAAQLGDSSGLSGRLRRAWPFAKSIPESFVSPASVCVESEAHESLEAELSLYREIVTKLGNVCAQAADGNLEPRIMHCPESPELAHAVVSVNHLLDMTDAFLREVGAALDHAARKQFYRQVLLRGMRGSFRRASQQINDASQLLANDSADLARIAESRRSVSETVKHVVEELTSTAAQMNTTTHALAEMAGVTNGSGAGPAPSKTALATTVRASGSSEGKSSRHLQQAVTGLYCFSPLSHLSHLGIFMDFPAS